MPRDLAEALAPRVATLWNMYGPTETTIWSSVLPVKAEIGQGVAVGGPIDNTRFYILDDRLQPVPVGVPGELFIGGDGLAFGYWARPDLTAERFLPDPFAVGTTGARMYRTGDLARWHCDGTLDFLGRSDFQVKVRGFRVETGEIEVHLAAHPAVVEARVVAVGEKAGDTALAAYLVVTDKPSPTSADLRAFLIPRLPDYMVPSFFVALPALPLTPSGKLDRKALPPPDPQQNLANGRRRPPDSATEKIVADSWINVLGVPSVSAEDNFFDLGGHSLKAVRAVMDVARVTGRRIGLADLFINPVLSEFARIVEAAEMEQSPAGHDSVADDFALLSAAELDLLDD